MAQYKKEWREIEHIAQFVDSIRVPQSHSPLCDLQLILLDSRPPREASVAHRAFSPGLPPLSPRHLETENTPNLIISFDQIKDTRITLPFLCSVTSSKTLNNNCKACSLRTLSVPITRAAVRNSSVGDSLRF